MALYRHFWSRLLDPIFIHVLKLVSSNQRDVTSLSMLTIRDLYAHIIVIYHLITLLTIYCVNMRWREMLNACQWFRLPEYLTVILRPHAASQTCFQKDWQKRWSQYIFESVRVLGTLSYHECPSILARKLTNH